MKATGDRTHGLKGRKRSNQQPASQKQELALKSKSRQTKRPRQSPTACSVKCNVVESGKETELEPNEGMKDRKAVSPVRKSGARSEKYVGAHLSIQGGIWKAVLHSVEIGGRALGLFLRSPRSWRSRPLEEKVAERFRLCCKEHDFSVRFILPHSPYVMNLGSPKSDVFEKSRTMLVEELQCCQQLGLTLYNIHPGSGTDAASVEECLDRIADGINYAHGHVEGVTVVLENMSCQGATIGGKFEELRGIIDRVQDKSRIGVCLDTCHAFAAGYDLSKKEGLQKMLDEFSSLVGLHYLKAIHLNDSKVFVCNFIFVIHQMKEPWAATWTDMKTSDEDILVWRVSDIS